MWAALTLLSHSFVFLSLPPAQLPSKLPPAFLTFCSRTPVGSGLILYAADLALRAGQMSNITTVTAATVDEDAGMATITLSADKVGAMGIVQAQPLYGALLAYCCHAAFSVRIQTAASHQSVCVRTACCCSPCSTAP